MLKMIYAIGPDKEFGYEDELPWDAPGDLRHFAEYTKDGILLMSSATFKSLPTKLNGRLHVVIGGLNVTTKDGTSADISFGADESLYSIKEYLSDIFDQDIIVIGGRKLLLEASVWAEDVSISEISKEYLNKPADDKMIRFDDSRIRKNLKVQGIITEVTAQPFGYLFRGNLEDSRLF